MSTPSVEDQQQTEGIKKSLATYLDLIPAIVWRIDIVKNAISFLNSYTIQTGEENLRAILQNPQLANKRILAEDKDRFQHCQEQIRKRIKTACTFRLRMGQGVIKWFKLVAMPDPVFITSSIGILIEISSQVNTILASEGRPTLSNKIDLISDPVLLVRFSDRTITAANKAALTFLQYDHHQVRALNFQQLLEHNPTKNIHEIYEGLIFSDTWSGTLNISDSLGRVHQCSTRMQAVSRDEENLLWITMSHCNDCTACKGIPVHGNETTLPAPLSKAMEQCTTVKEVLETILKSLPPDSPTDAIMLSRIFIDKNRVVVTGAGAPFESDTENHTHPYEGSIAENIVRFDLPNHVVMETSKSIKPIDWALFIPRGIRSYYAQPFFKNGILTAVLIFCSTKTRSYDPDADAPLLALHEEIIKNITKCIKK